MEGEKTKLMISTQRQRVVEKEAETERKKAVIDAEKESYVAKIQYEKLIMEKESMQKMAKIQDEMHLVRIEFKKNILISTQIASMVSNKNEDRLNLNENLILSCN